MAVIIHGRLVEPADNIPRAGVTLVLTSVKNSSVVLKHAIYRCVTGGNGEYSFQTEPGEYDVSVSVYGSEPERVGRIRVYKDSEPGSLNKFLLTPGEDDFTPDIIKLIAAMCNAAAESAHVAQNSAHEAQQAAKTCADLAQQVATDKSDVAQSASAVTEAKQEVVQLHDQVVTLHQQVDLTAGQVAQDKNVVVTTSNQVRADAEQVTKDKQQVELIAADVQKQAASASQSASQALDAQTVVSKLAEEVSENASLVSSSTAQVEENTQVVRGLASDVAQKHAEVLEKTDAAVNAAGEAERCATEAGEHRASALDAAQRAEKAASDAEHVMAGAMQAENCLSEIAALGEEAKHNARQNLGMGNAAVMDVQQDIYDRTAGRAALPGAFGYGSELKAEPTFSAKNGPSEFLTWVRNAKQGRYYVSQYGGPNSRPIIDTSDNVVFSGVIEIIFPEPAGQVTDDLPYAQMKLVWFYGVNGDVYFNRYSATGGDKLIGWENWKLKVDDFTRVLRSGIGGANWRNPDIGGLILAVYVGKSDGDQVITLNRLESVQGSRLRLIDIKRSPSGDISVIASQDSSTMLAGTYQALSGYGGTPSEAGCISLFMRIA